MYNQTVYESTGGIFSAVKAKEIEMEGRDLALLTDLYELTMMPVSYTHLFKGFVLSSFCK